MALKTMKMTKISEKTNISSEEMLFLLDAVLLFKMENDSQIPKLLKQRINELPSKYYVANQMSNEDIQILYGVIKKMWKEISGKNVDDLIQEARTKPSGIEILDGNYWMLPGGFLIGGFNHFSIAKKNKSVFCSMLDINPLVFERLICEDPQKLIHYVIVHGGVRTNISQKDGRVICQTNEQSWPWVRNKLMKMYHKTKIAKVVDLKANYNGWASGVNISFN